ncbi:MAG: DUF2853 family protein [Pararhizobium sp.]
MSDHLADIKRYDPAPDADAVNKIVRHLGIALRSRDGSLVSCSDDAEIARVKEKWCRNKLGVDGTAAEDAIMTVCQAMSADRSKERVTFYYLVAKELGKLDSL